MSNKVKFDLVYWLTRCEQLIVKHSTPARTRGKYKGHSSTDSCAWVSELSTEVSAWISKTSKGIGYDENMALACRLGMILSAWYSLVHRAKSYDANRPVNLRRRANKRCTEYRGALMAAVCDDSIMGKVWGEQVFSPPYGKGVKGGKFV